MLTADDCLPPQRAHAPAAPGLRACRRDGSDLVTWRLVSGNGRELGRGTEEHPTVDDALAAGRALAARSGDLLFRTHPSGPRGWRWSARLGDAVVAVAPRAFDRRVRCEQGVELFRAGLAAVALPAAVTALALGPLVVGDAALVSLLDAEDLVVRAGAS